MGDRGIRLVVVSACAVLAGSVLVGCSGGDDPPTTLPTVSSSAAPTTEPPPSSPAGTRKERRKAEVEAAVRAYYEAMDLAMRTGDTGPYLRLTTRTCPCRGLVDDIDAEFEPSRFPGAGASLVEIHGMETVGELADVHATYRVHAYRHVDGSGQTIDTYPERLRSVSLALVLNDSIWRVDSSVRLDSE